MTTHGMTGTPAFQAWLKMRERCGDASHPQFHRYGGRGIKVCAAWSKSFEAFYQDMGAPPPRHQIDRVDNDRDYEPGNCRWVTSKQNNRNRSNNVNVVWDGRSQTIAGWAEELGMLSATLWHRLDRWPLERAMTEPVRRDKRRAA